MPSPTSQRAAGGSRLDAARAPDPADNESDEIADRSKIQLVAVGMKESELRAQFGAPKLQVPYTFKGHLARHLSRRSGRDTRAGA